MTMEEINKIFPPDYAGVAQISDLRLALTYLMSTNELGGIEFYEVLTLTEMYNLQDLNQGDICKVEDTGGGISKTYIYDQDQWKLLVEPVTGGGSGPVYNKATEIFNITSTDEAYQEVALQQTPTPFEHLFVYLNGVLLAEGPGNDFTISGNVIQFEADVITEDDQVQVKYAYLP
jgi:hypothetical protein